MKQVFIALIHLMPLIVCMTTIEEIQQGMLFFTDNKFNPNRTDPINQKYITDLTNAFFLSLKSFHPTEPDPPSIATCQEHLLNLIVKNISNFYELFSFNGKRHSDVGEEDACLYFNHKYFKAFYEMKQDTTQNEENEVIQFLNLDKFYIGLCLPEVCLTALQLLQQGTIPNTLFDYIEKTYFLKNITFLEPPAKLSPSNYLWFTILIYIIIGYFLLKILFTFIRVSCFSSDNTTNSKIQENRLEPEEEEETINTNMNLDDKLDDDDNDNDNKKSKIEKKPKSDFIFSKNSLTPVVAIDTLPRFSLSSRNSMESSCSLFVKFFDFFDNIHILTIFKSKYYNDKHISIFAFVRVILMFLLAYNHTFFATTKMPGKEFLDSTFYKSFLFFSVKISVHALPLWIVVDSTTFIYKFMSSIKKEMWKKKTTSVSITFILKWWLYTIPKILLFFFNFFFFHVFINYYKVFFNTGTMFEYYLQNFQERPCTERPWELLIPFFISYRDNARSYVYCYRFVYVFLNEFYCFIVLTLFFYVILKIKSKIADYAFLVIAALNMLLTCVSIKFSNADYDINNVLGQTITDKYTHLTLSFYLMGVFVGMCYFYYYDAVSEGSLSQNYTYFPFFYCYICVTWLDRLKTIWKKVLLWSCFLILFFDSMSYMFMRLTRQTELKTLCFPMDTFINIYEQYDKILFALIFSFIMILLLLFPKDTTIKHVIASNLFFPFSRIGTAFFCLSNTIIYIAYCIFVIQLKLTYPNLFYITIGLFVIISVVSLFIALMFEMPFRVLIKMLVRWMNEKDLPALDEMVLLDQINQSMRILEDDE